MNALYIFDSGYFNCGVEVKDGIVVRAAPIVKYMMGWSEKRVVEYAEKKKWEIHHAPLY